jgi:serine/threonine protein kinase
VQALFKQILEAVTFLHDRGVVHRDLKPENVLLRKISDPADTVKPSWEVVLADFGFATWAATGAPMTKDATAGLNPISKIQWLQSVVGTPSYMAPEIVDARVGVPGYDFSADMWSCGVILYIWYCFLLLCLCNIVISYSRKISVWVASSRSIVRRLSSTRSGAASFISQTSSLATSRTKRLTSVATS